jgi:hypothetical protein
MDPGGKKDGGTGHQDEDGAGHVWFQKHEKDDAGQNGKVGDKLKKTNPAEKAEYGVLVGFGRLSLFFRGGGLSLGKSGRKKEDNGQLGKFGGLELREGADAPDPASGVVPFHTDAGDEDQNEKEKGEDQEKY